MGARMPLAQSYRLALVALTVLAPRPLCAVPTRAAQTLQPDEAPPQPFNFGPPTEYDRVLSQLNAELLNAYHTKDAKNHTSIYPLLNLMSASSVEDDDGP